MRKLIDTAHIKVVLAAIVWGSSGVFIKYLGLPAPLIAFFRVGIPVAVLAAWFIYHREPIFVNGIRLMLVASAVNALRLIFYFVGYLNAPIGNAVIILYTWPVFAVLMGYFFLNEPMPPRNIGLLVLAMAGIALVFSGKPFSLENQVFIGMGAMLLSALLNAASVTLFKHQSPRFSPLKILFFQNFLGVLVFLPFVFIHGNELTCQKTTIASLYALLVGVAGYGLFFFALRSIRASTASFLAYIEVVSAVLFGVWVFDEALSLHEIAGGSMILLASVMLKK